MKSVMKISETLIVFKQIMKGLLAYHNEAPNLLQIGDISEIAIRLTQLEMEEKAKQRHAERQDEINKIMVQVVASYIESLLKPSPPLPFPFPLINPLAPGFIPGSELDKATGVGENKNVESDAKPVPESQG